LLEALTNLGVTPDNSTSDAKYIALTNSLCLVAIGVNLSYLVMNSLMGEGLWFQLGPPILGGAMYLGPLWLNHLKRYWQATTFMCLGTLAVQLVFVFAFGYDSGNHLFMLPLLGGIPLVYPPRHWRTAAVLVVAVLVAFTAVVLAGPRIGPFIDLEPGVQLIYYTLALSLTAFVIAVVSYYAHRRTAIAESLLEARSRELAQALAELQMAQAQMIETANQAVLGRFMAGLLHEINSPLGSIRSAADTLKVALERCRKFIRNNVVGEDLESQRVLKALDVSANVGEVLHDATARISTLVEGLRQFVALDEADQKLFDVRVSIDGVLAILAPSIDDRIEIVRRYPQSVRPVMGSPAKLNRALMSVVQNSVQAIEIRGVIQINVYESADGVEVEVADNGKGIPEANVADIFEIGLTRRKGRVGMRLGLPMSKRSLEEMGGRLTLQSVEGGGTTVRMTLPASRRDAP
jgi:signal transduction histidine kinase